VVFSTYDMESLTVVRNG